MLHGHKVFWKPVLSCFPVALFVWECHSPSSHALSWRHVKHVWFALWVGSGLSSMTACDIFPCQLTPLLFKVVFLCDFSLLCTWLGGCFAFLPGPLVSGNGSLYPYLNPFPQKVGVFVFVTASSIVPSQGSQGPTVCFSVHVFKSIFFWQFYCCLTVWVCWPFLFPCGLLLPLDLLLGDVLQSKNQLLFVCCACIFHIPAPLLLFCDLLTAC